MMKAGDIGSGYSLRLARSKFWKDVSVESVTVAGNGRGLPLRDDMLVDEALRCFANRGGRSFSRTFLRRVDAACNGPEMFTGLSPCFVRSDSAVPTEVDEPLGRAPPTWPVAEDEGLHAGGFDAQAKAFQFGIPNFVPPLAWHSQID